MLSSWIPLGLLILGVNGGGAGHQQHTVVDVTTVLSTKTVPVTHYVDITKYNYVNITKTSTVWECITKYTTTTLHFTVSTTETDFVTTTSTKTDWTAITNTKTDWSTITNTKTDFATITNTKTESTTLTNTQTTTTTVQEIVTTYSTTTLIFTTVDPCPTTCTVSAGTVTVFFWPTDRPHTYPPTYVHPTLGYTFVSPSVYMLIDTARGTNTLGQPAGPSTASWLLALDLSEVSTIVSKTITRQLTLSDLGTDCPQTADPTAIATMLDDPRCNPILAAPTKVRSWASPCNACGRFGLFDPPYAVPTLPGGLVPTTPVPPVVTTPVPPAVTSPAPLPSTTTRAAPVPVPAAAPRVTGGLVWVISSIAMALFLF